MTRLARQIRARRPRSVRTLAEPGQVTPETACRPDGDSSDQALRLAKKLYAIRRNRDRAFGPACSVFRDPAWDMMLDLFAARLEGRKTSLSSAAIAACIPQTTAIRLVDHLIERNLLRRATDEADARRTLLELTPMATDMMWRFLMSTELDPAAPADRPERGN